jgi:hypothetical protein
VAGRVDEPVAALLCGPVAGPGSHPKGMLGAILADVDEADRPR